MKLDRRWTGALAFGALVVVIAVPSSEVLNANFAGSAVPAQIAPVAPTAGTADPVETASIDPVDSYLATGKPLPDFISGGAAEAAIGPQVTVTDRNSGVKRVIPATGGPVVLASPTAPPTQVATATPSASTAPVPFPLSMRPTPSTTPTSFSGPAVSAPVTPAAPTMETARVGDEIILPPPVDTSPSYAAVPPSPGYQPANPIYQPPANSGYQPFDTTQVARVPSEPADYWEYGPTVEYIGGQPPRAPSGQVTEFANGYADAEGNFYFYEDNQAYQQGYDDSQYQPRRRQPFLQSLFGNN